MNHPSVDKSRAERPATAVAFGIVFGACLLAPACTPPGPNDSPWPARASTDTVVAGPPYDPRSVVNVHGAIVRVDDPAGAPMPQVPVVLLIQATDKRLKVRLLPRAYLDRERVVLAPGDIVDVVGTRTPGASDETVQARELRGSEGRVLLRLQDDGDGGVRPMPLR